MSKANNSSVNISVNIRNSKKSLKPRQAICRGVAERQSAESLERAHGSLKEVTWWGLTCQPDTKLEAGAGLVTGSIQEQ